MPLYNVKQSTGHTVAKRHTLLLKLFKIQHYPATLAIAAVLEYVTKHWGFNAFYKHAKSRLRNAPMCGIQHLSREVYMGESGMASDAAYTVVL